MTKILLLLLTAMVCGLTNSFGPIRKAQPGSPLKPKIAFTFDDGSIDDFGEYKLETWNQLLLNQLKKNRLKAILFSAGANKSSLKGKYVLNSWNDAGHLIANHTFSHVNFNSEQVSLEDFKRELTKNDSLIKGYAHYTPYFRFPYLKEGNTKEKVEGFRAFLKQKRYRNGHVTIDASDWYIDARLIERLKEDPTADLTGYRTYYKQHLLNRALYYDSLAYRLTKRCIHHVLLLHHNLAAALFVDDLIQHFKANGWEVIDADQAYKDPIYAAVSISIPAGESLIWALAKASGRFESVLRYPAEDEVYEKPRMDRLGL